MERNSNDGHQMTEQQIVAALLDWHEKSGISEIVGDNPINRLSTKPLATETPIANAAPTTQAAAAQPAAPNRRSAQNTATIDTRSLAKSCATIDELKEAIAGFQGLDITRTATNTVFADGNPDADLMLVGEAPGAEEDRKGLPFVGAAGQLLDKMLAAIGRDRSSVYISNVLNWRPPGNRTPTPEEATMCLPLIRRHIQLADPKVVVLLGGTSAKHLIGTSTGITRLRGRWTEILIDDDTSETKPALPIFHPAYLLRQTGHKKLAWRDLLILDEKLRTLEHK